MKTDTDILHEPAKILLVEDNKAHADLAIEALKDTKIHVSLDVVDTGENALQYLRQENEFENSPKPDLILLDLNLPGIDGREVLDIIKSDLNLKCIPIIILTTSDSEIDMLRAYNSNANCYIKKPVDYDHFQQALHKLTDFWFTLARIPKENVMQYHKFKWLLYIPLNIFPVRTLKQRARLFTSTMMRVNFNKH